MERIFINLRREMLMWHVCIDMFEDLCCVWIFIFIILEQNI